MRKGKKLPPLPVTISAPLGNVPVKFVADLAINGRPGFGAYEVLTRRIMIRTEMARENEWLTLEHERFHRILRDAGINMNRALEERLADAVAADRVYQMLWPDERRAARKVRKKK